MTEKSDWFPFLNLVWLIVFAGFSYMIFDLRQQNLKLMAEKQSTEIYIYGKDKTISFLLEKLDYCSKK